MSTKIVLISAGHTNKAGQDRGAAGNGFVEGAEALKLRYKTAEYLRQYENIEVWEDGQDGDNQPLSKALTLARKANRPIEYHFNAGPPTATGIEVLGKSHHKEVCQKLAGAIHIATGLKLRGDKGYKSDKSGQHHRLAFCEAGGVIVEVCFISNKADMEAYKQGFEAICKNVADVLATTKF
jgi:N-acetylmuramoyl-L-alanine amidase